MSNDIETREIADTELDAVSGGLADVIASNSLTSTGGVHVSALDTEIAAGGTLADATGLVTRV